MRSSATAQRRRRSRTYTTPQVVNIRNYTAITPLSFTVHNNAGTAVSGAEVEAQQNGTTVNSTVTGADGTFTIDALPAGSYTLVVLNSFTTLGGTQSSATGFDASVGTTLSVTNAVTVTAGQTAQAGVIKD